MGNEWTTIRIKRARKDAVAVRAEADGLSAAEWADRALAAALANGGRGDPGPARVVAHETKPAPPRASKPARKRAVKSAASTSVDWALERQRKMNQAKGL